MSRELCGNQRLMVGAVARAAEGAASAGAGPADMVEQRAPAEEELAGAPGEVWTAAAADFAGGTAHGREGTTPPNTGFAERIIYY